MIRVLPVATLVLAAALLSSCRAPEAPPEGGSPQDLQITVLRAGDGAIARSGDVVRVHYTGWLYDERLDGRKGASFDSSLPRGEPFSFPLGRGVVIRGWDEGVVGMKVGEVRELAIPADLGYGRQGAGRVIPPHQPLLFEVELLAVEPAR